MPRTTRSSKSTAPSPAPLSNLQSDKAQETLDKAVQETGIEVQPEQDEEEQETKMTRTTRTSGDAKGKGKAKAIAEEVEDVVVEEQEPEQEQGQGKKVSPEERLAKLKELRTRMNQSTQANRKSLIEDHQKQKTTHREIARLEKQKKLADNLREKIDADENGVDVGRKKNWGWSIEQNQKWLQAEQDKQERGTIEFDDRDSNAQRVYNKDTRKLKPDLAAYNRQKETALGLAPGTIVPVGAKGSSSSAIKASTNRALGAMEDLYRDGNTLSYGDNKASDDAIDRVVGKMNDDMDKRHKKMRKRKAADDDGGDVTYINDANKVFNRKINRYFDKYTTEIRANFERGTAL